MTSLTGGNAAANDIRKLMEQIIAERDAKFAPKKEGDEATPKGGMFDKPEVKANDGDVITDLLGYLEQKRTEALDSYQSKVMRRSSKPLPKPEDIDVSSFLSEAGLSSQPEPLTFTSDMAPALGEPELEQVADTSIVKPSKTTEKSMPEVAIEEPTDTGNGLMSSPRPKARPTESSATKVSADAPINVRNNNLGNIKNIKSNDWKGQTNLDSDETFASFSSPELGVRALKKVIQSNINATNTIEEYVNRYASEPKEKAYYKKNGKLMPHLENYATKIAKSQGLDSTTAAIPKDVDMLSWIKATAIAEGGADALTYFTDDVINKGLAL